MTIILFRDSRKSGLSICAFTLSAFFVCFDCWYFTFCIVFCNWRRVFASKLLEILFWFCLQIIAQCCTHLTHFVGNSICLLWITLILVYNCQLESYVLLILFGKRMRFIRFKIQRSCFRSELFVRKSVLFCSTYKLGFALTLHPWMENPVFHHVMVAGYDFTVKLSTVFKSYFTATRVTCATQIKRLTRFLARHWLEAARKLLHPLMNRCPII